MSKKRQRVLMGIFDKNNVYLFRINNMLYQKEGVINAKNKS